MGNDSQLTGGRFLVDLWHKDAIQARFLQSLVDAINRLGFNLGANAVGDFQPPPPVQNVNVKASGELLHVTLDHNALVNRGIEYFVEIAANDPNFSRPLVVPLGTSRSSHPIPLPTNDDSGNPVSYYVRAYCQYRGGPPSKPTVFGGPLNPASIKLGGSTKLTLLNSTGSGTSASNGQRGGQGFGKYPQSQPLPKVGTTATQANYQGVVATAPTTNNYLGAYSATVAYQAGNEVSFNGNTYVAIAATTGNAPTNTTYWSIIGPANSVQVVGSPSFSVSSTSSSITVAWNNFNILLPNGQTIAVSNGSQTITGLSASTTYSLFPYYSYATQSIAFVASSAVTLPNLAGVSVSGSGYVTTSASLSTNAGSSQISVELWVYPTNGSGNLISLGPGGPSIQLNAFASGSYTIAANGSTGDSGSVNGGTLIPNFWNYVVVTFAMGSGPGATTIVTIYLNGVQITQSTQSINSVSSYKWIIAADSSNGGQGSTNAQGIFAFAAVYSSTILTAAKVASHYNAMLQSGTGAYATLVAADGGTYLWELNETSGTTAADSIDSNTGTYNGTYTLGDSQAIGGASGSPAEAWANPPLAVTLAQYLQSQIPLSAGGLTVATTASGSSGGSVAGGYYAPALPQGLFT